jgi:hypothetical protein
LTTKKAAVAISMPVTEPMASPSTKRTPLKPSRACFLRRDSSQNR